MTPDIDDALIERVARGDYPRGFHDWPLNERNKVFAAAETRRQSAEKKQTRTPDEPTKPSEPPFEPFDSDRGIGFSEFEWPEPRPLPDGLLPVAPFDMAFLPEAIGPWVADISDRMNCPPDYVGIPAIIALGSLIGRRVGIRPQAHTDWIEIANLWGCIVGRPGMLKSPAMREAMKPLNRLEVKARESNECVRRDYDARLELYKIRKEDARKDASTNKSTDLQA
jgi:hypothetical protein